MDRHRQKFHRPHRDNASVGKISDKITLDGTTGLPGHTEGCTTFTMSVDEGGKKLLAVIAGGWSSNPGVRYVAAKSKPASYPDIVQDFEHAFATYESLPADIFHGAHGYPDLWIDRDGYKAVIAKAHANFEVEPAKQKATR